MISTRVQTLCPKWYCHKNVDKGKRCSLTKKTPLTPLLIAAGPHCSPKWRREKVFQQSEPALDTL